MADAVVRLGYNDSELQNGLNRSARHVKRFEQETKGAFGGLRGALTGSLGLLGISTGIAGVKALVDEFDRLGDLAQQLDVSPEAIQRLGMMAKLSGSDVESVAKALSKVNKELATSEGKKAFHELGINIAAYKSLEADKQIVMLAEAFQTAEAKGQGLNHFYDLMGKGLTGLLPLLRSSKSEMKAMSEQDVISAAQMKQLQAANDWLDKLGGKAKVFAMKTGQGTANFFGDMIEGFKDIFTGVGSGWEGFFRRGEKEKADAAKDAEEDQKKRERDARQARRNEIKELLTEMAKARAESNDDADTQDNLTRSRERLLEIDQKIASLQGGGDEAEILRATIEREAVMRSIHALEEKIADREREIVKLQGEIKIAQLRRSGEAKSADALEKEVKLRSEAARLAKQTNMDEKDVYDMLKQKARIEEQTSKHKRADGRHRSQGYTQDRRQDYRDHSAFQDLQRSPTIRDRMKTPGLDELHRLNSLIRRDDGVMVRPKAFPVKTKTDRETQAQRTAEAYLRKIAENTANLPN